MFFSRLLLSYFLLLSVCFLFAQKNDPQLRIATNRGIVQGQFDPDTGVKMWTGIPYAAPPVGFRRFRVPVEPEPWSGVLQTIQVPPPICLQMSSTNVIGSEDCLYLNVFAPKNSTYKSLLPVMVYIHGGAFIYGNSWGIYQGQNITATGDVVVVTMTYRLGAFGFLSLKELKEEDINHSTGNYGVQDQQMALKWVRDNIARFGGNPNQVTLFGESAGAMSVCFHIVSPFSKGLFHAAIMESGTCDNPVFFSEFSDTSMFGQAVAESIGCTSNIISCLRAANTSLFFNLVVESSYLPRLYPVIDWAITIDGSDAGLPSLPLKMIQQGNYAKVPLIIGTNLNEGTMFTPIITMKVMKPETFPDKNIGTTLNHFFLPNTTAAILKQYPKTSFSGLFPNTERMNVIIRDCFFTCASRRIVRAMEKFQTPSWLYQFIYKAHWMNDITGNVAHGSELAFVFNNQYPKVGTLLDPAKIFTASDQEMANIMGYYWTNMAKLKSPEGKEYPDWPQYNSILDQNLELNSASTRVNQGLYSINCDFWDIIYSNPSNVIH